MTNNTRFFTFTTVLLALLVMVLIISSCSFFRQFQQPNDDKLDQDQYCYGEFLVSSDTLKGIFKSHNDSIFFASLRKLNDLHKTYPITNELQTAMYYIGSISSKEDTVRIERNSKDISIAHQDILDFQTYVFPKVEIGKFRYSISHVAISKSPRYRRFERVFYFTEGRVCPDSIVSSSKESSFFIYD